MGLTMTKAVRYVQERTGYPRFRFITENEIAEEIRTNVIDHYSHYFPYMAGYRIIPEEDTVDMEKFPGLFRITPKDCDIHKIWDVGMCYIQSDIAMGGYPRDLGRTVYGGSMGVGALLYNQLNINIMSMVQPQQSTAEFVPPNFVQIYPKRKFYLSQQQIWIDLLLYHADDLHTIQNSYELWFKKLSVLYCKALIYDRYKDLDQEVVGGHQARTMIQNYSSAEDDIEALTEKMDDEYVKNPERLDFYIV
jgi:hypothetical protein